MTSDELTALWGDRDARYAMRKQNGNFLLMSDREVFAVKDWRRAEVDRLPPDQRAHAWQVLNLWEPPGPRRR